jgi:N-carbamoyl-L-amino-acid hydrolase
MNRRELIAGAAATAAVAAARKMEALQGAGSMRINAARLRAHLEGLSVYGRPAGGTFADGVSRTAYSDADVAGRKYVIGLMRDAGLETKIDPAGNIWGRRPGVNYDAAKPIIIGSHIDSVKQGGNFDGDVGSLGAIEVMQTLNEQKAVTSHPLEVVVWTAEESNYGAGLSGSRAAAGAVQPGEMDRVQDGVVKRDAVRKIGGDPDRIAEARLAPGSFAAYLELHIEQGGTLDAAGINIGVVEGIVGINDFEVTIRGFANHAGTTPMNQRKDALVAASRLVLAVREIVTSEPGRQVGTVGTISVSPGAPNVIPGVARLTIDLRDLDPAKLKRLSETVRARAQEIAQRNGCEIEMTQTGADEAALTAKPIQEAIERAADKLALTHRRLPSGAGHDAQQMARLGPIGMIFVPSVGGISHSPKEFSRWEDCANGADVLMGTVLELDRT